MLRAGGVGLAVQTGRGRKGWWLGDRNTKKAHYQRLGVPSYWLLDPVAPGGLEVHELDEQGQYQVVAKVSGDEVCQMRRPLSADICPARLLDGLRAVPTDSSSGPTDSS